MKILSLILVALIVFLTIQPVLTQANFFVKQETQTIDKCCANKQDANSSKDGKQQQKDNNCCNNGHCNNPFLTCANCYFIKIDKVLFLPACTFIQTEKIAITNDKILPAYRQDFWHPPKVS